MIKPRRTKIIATLGPSTDSQLLQMIESGMDLARINFSHGQTEEHRARILQVRESALQAEKEIGIIADLQGPKIRIAEFKNHKIDLKEGASFNLDPSFPEHLGDEQTVSVDYKGLAQDVHPKDRLLLDDGRIVLRVNKVSGSCIQCEVEVGGELSDHKGINREGGGLSVAALTDKDKFDLKIAAESGADYIAISFPKSAEDMLEAKHLLQSAGIKAGLIAKIERAEAIDNIDEIIRVSDAVMVARGDLGVEIGDAELPEVQKHIIHRARALDKLAITATQMMESMIHNAIPTRAEVFDVANAVLDGTDAVMLSAETATGDHPAKVIEAMARICLGAEKQVRARVSRHRVECQFQKVDEAIAMAAMYTANHFNIAAIIAFTESGATPLWMSRIRSGIPIYGFTPSIATQRRMTLFRGVYPVHFKLSSIPWEQINRQAIEELRQKGIVTSGDYVIITYGDTPGLQSSTNNLKILPVS